MALACSVLSAGQAPTSAVHAVFGGSGFSAAGAAGSLLPASLCDGAEDSAGSGLPGAVASGTAERGGSFSPRLASAGSGGAAFEIAADARSPAGSTAGPPLPAHKAMAAAPTNARTTA